MLSLSGLVTVSFDADKATDYCEQFRLVIQAVVFMKELTSCGSAAVNVVGNKEL